jgi:hypothetical protein
VGTDSEFDRTPNSTEFDRTPNSTDFDLRFPPVTRRACDLRALVERDLRSQVRRRQAHRLRRRALLARIL